MPGRLEGKVALITGAARGIGKGHAEIFAEEGASVVVSDVLVEQGEEVAAQLREQGHNAVFQKLDVSSEADWAAAVEAATANFGKLTTLVNNAAIFNNSGVDELLLDDWNKVIAVNLTGVFLGMKAVLPELEKSGNGAIVNISSLYAIIATDGFAAYHASKSGVRMLSKATALRYTRRGVRVNTILPGNVVTPAASTLTEEENAAILKLVPMGVRGQPSDVAYGSLYLASDEARYVTGSELVIDGGWSLP
ncbi:glucose 1-dehydrogenase [Desulfovibrio aminophilus]|uniref:SDR family NAD(P)-dependent oxidoreductase n=1 Tax=Desulfovibrio aminophilus TaxID=81425 RepID=UPI003399F7AF